MKYVKPLSLNLASRPARNRRLFFGLAGILAIVFLVVAGWGASLFFAYSGKGSSVRTSITKLRSQIAEMEREEKKYQNQVTKTSREQKRRVDMINTLIQRKSFSWVGFFSILEENLPASCYIVSMTPIFREDASMDLRLRVAAPDLKTMFTFIDRLEAADFKNTRLLNETSDENDALVYEISINYERAN